MKAGPFIATIAEFYGVDEKTVRLIARLLREAGHLTQGPRGRGAPHMTPKDAATLTLALLATQSPAQSVEAFEYNKDLIPDRSTQNFPSEDLNSMNLLNFLTFLFEMDGSIPDAAKLSIFSHLSNAAWEVPGHKMVVYVPTDIRNADGSDNPLSKVYQHIPGIRQDRSLTGYYMNEIKERAFPVTE
ncbi:hypothetical protein [Phaeobacter inhibens]|uniref:hypothetical protein n=2 Tax=Phaeobacter inhibens TaxID=221822 RepID=UPI000C9C0D57|nr:hypothetical protein [Phaeobacter inhibens]AUQ55168.1 hypothetical protein PhaeoP92_02514 [Phaeobacter inhibens]AUQ79184.1 hypothetical protein PhaeoP74_02515 [Phaeobacter inhibens]AUR16343.1 hypothetical protein PhaeoP70_02513 [Phaeobacter inhibens]